MKKDIHPKTYPITIKFTNGKEIKLDSTLGKKEGNTVHNAGDWPFDSHPAWTKSHTGSVKSTTNVKKFQQKFGGAIFDGFGASAKEN